MLQSEFVEPPKLKEHYESQKFSHIEKESLSHTTESSVSGE